MKKEIMVNDHEWKYESESDDYFIYWCWWWGLYGDGVDLYINKDGKGFELDIGGKSKIYIDVADFYPFWTTFANGNISDHSYIEQCVIIADGICTMLESKGILSYVKPKL